LRRHRSIELVVVLLLALVAGACRRYFPTTWPERLKQAEAVLVESGASAQERFYVLPTAAKAAYELGQYDKAAEYANEALSLAPDFPDDWNYGHAMHDGHMVLGRLALHRGDLDAALRELAEAGETPGSPQLYSFGPNMSLANDLLARGQSAAVLEYFRRCARFWHMGSDRLRSWTANVEANQSPDFGANLFF